MAYFLLKRKEDNKRFSVLEHTLSVQLALPMVPLEMKLNGE